LSAWGNEQEKNQNVQNENNNDTNVNYENFTVDKNSSNQQYIIHNFSVDYQQKPTHFNFLCPYELFNKTNKINNISCHKFNNEHLQYNTHNLYSKYQKFQFYKITQYLHKKNNPENYT
jgi:hypothetical protein